MSGVPSRLRVAVVASDATVRNRLAALVARSGHEVVELTAAPDVILTDGAIDSSPPAPAVAIGPVEGDLAGRLPPDATVEQIDAALRAAAWASRRTRSNSISNRCSKSSAPARAPKPSSRG